MNTKFAKYAFLSLLAALSVLSACKVEEESLDNIINFNGENFKLYRGYQKKDGETTTKGTPYRLFLLGEGVSYNSTSGGFTGIGSMVEFTIHSGSSAEVKPGLYTIDIFKNDSIGYASNCKVYHNYNHNQEVDTGKTYTIKAGTFDVDNLGSAMKYKMSLVVDTILFNGTFRASVDPL